MKRARVSLVVVHYGSPQLLMDLLASLQSHPDRSLIGEVVVVNNGLGLDQETRDRLMISYFSVNIIDNAKNSYSSGVNQGVRASQGEILIIANNDVQWLPGYSIGLLLEDIQDSKIGIVGPQLVYPSGDWQQSHRPFPSIGSAFQSVVMVDSLRDSLARRRFRKKKRRSAKSVDYVDGAFMVIRRRCFEEVGGFDESFPFYGEDADFCFRARKAGWRTLFDPRVRILHQRGASSTKSERASYAKLLIDAQLNFVRVHYSSSHSRVYLHLLRFALCLRTALYQLISRFSPSKEWKARAEHVKVKYRVICEEFG